MPSADSPVLRLCVPVVGGVTLVEERGMNEVISHAVPTNWNICKFVQATYRVVAGLFAHCQHFMLTMGLCRPNDVLM